ncbi:TIGR03757 family integrating conjugative element protein [Burkholderia sola]|uniref:TIGR03757 family integrating conjugative element protein n=1 Tax=Burkholderia TaxID=32008 RepID=UPI001AE2E311|nr:TIGR03757 family integrating conjugative element protein [Burkholderia sp. AcTa6-5]MBP0714281.1 TIGR03757 family integrating conjugative element protein [Burkholderia sp. AcTa6-5]
MKLPHLAATALLALQAAAALPVLAADLHVFTDRAHPVRGVPAGAVVVELDTAAQLEAELAADLPGDAGKAAPIVQRRLEQGGPELQRRLAVAYQGVTEAWSLGVTKVPAAVVEHSYVVYGEPDVSIALARIAQYRKEH